jgi:hypothetical protein
MAKEGSHDPLEREVKEHRGRVLWSERGMWRFRINEVRQVMSAFTL